MTGGRITDRLTPYIGEIQPALLQQQMCVFKTLSLDIREQSDKCLTSSPEGATIATEIYYRVVHSRRRLLSKFKSNRTRSFVLTACGDGLVRGFYKNGKRVISVAIGDSILVFGREIAQRNQRALGYCLCTVTLLLRWRPLKICLTSFNMVTRRTSVFD